MSNLSLSGSDEKQPLIAGQVYASGILDLSQGSCSGLDAIIGYNLHTSRGSGVTREILKQTFLLIVSVSGAPIYYLPASAYAMGDPHIMGIPVSSRNDVLWFFYVFGTVFPCSAVLYNATNTFLEMRSSESVPKELESFLTRRSKLRVFLEDMVILSVSALSSIPLMLTAVSFPIFDDPLAQGFYSIVVLIDNTLLHFLPVKLIMSDYFFGFPFRIVGGCCGCLPKLSDKDKQLGEFKECLAYRIEVIAILLAKNVFPGNGAVDSSLLGTFSAVNDMGQLCEFVDKLGGSEPSRSSSIGRIVFNFMGMFTAIVSCSGYYGTTYNSLREAVGEFIAFLLSAVPNYSLGTLIGFFGRKMSCDFWDYLSGHGEVNYQARAYPKIHMSIVAVSLALGVFSSAAAKQMVLENFATSSGLREFLLLVAELGVSCISVCAMKDFFEYFLDFWIKHFSSGEIHDLDEMITRIRKIAIHIRAMDDKVFLGSISNMGIDQIKILFSSKAEEVLSFLSGCNDPNQAVRNGDSQSSLLLASVN